MSDFFIFQFVSILIPAFYTGETVQKSFNNDTSLWDTEFYIPSLVQ